MESSDVIILDKIIKLLGEDSHWIRQNIYNNNDPEKDNYWLLGFLRSRRIEIVVFGLKVIAECGGLLMSDKFKQEYEEAKFTENEDGTYKWFDMKEANPQYCYDQDDPEYPCGEIESWRWHDQRMSGLPAIECLLYYGEFLEGEECDHCDGFGKEICDNPDHGFIGAMLGEISRIGCPACGHDEHHRTKNKCEHCNGTGRRK